jgi:pimeloyl-ACP methyl ester carboxylesterase
MPTARLILVHGTRVSHTQWDRYLDRFPGLEIVTPDLPGHGSRADEEFTTQAAVATISEAVEGGGRTGPVVLVGHSLGGYMAMAYAAQRPDRLSGLVLIGSSAVPEGAGAAVYRAFARLIERVGDERMGRISNRVLARLADEATAAAVLAGGASYTATAAAWAAVMADCRPSMLAHVGCPVLLVNGQFDQLGVHARRYRAACRDARVVTVPRATHLLPITHADVVAALLRDFVAEVLPGADSGPAAQT